LLHVSIQTFIYSAASKLAALPQQKQPTFKCLLSKIVLMAS